MNYFAESHAQRKQRYAIAAKQARLAKEAKQRALPQAGASPYVQVGTSPPANVVYRSEDPIELAQRAASEPCVIPQLHHFEQAEAYAQAHPDAFPSFPPARKCLIRAKAIELAKEELETHNANNSNT